jgi:hypothetical protein
VEIPADYDAIKVDPDINYNIEATDWKPGRLDGTLATRRHRGSLPPIPRRPTTRLTSGCWAGIRNGTTNPAYPVYLDPTNMIDEMLIVYWGGNLDAPISNFLSNQSPNNWFGFRNRLGVHGGFKFILHDSEHTLLNP